MKTLSTEVTLIALMDLVPTTPYSVLPIITWSIIFQPGKHTNMMSQNSHSTMKAELAEEKENLDTKLKGTWWWTW